MTQFNTSVCLAAQWSGIIFIERLKQTIFPNIVFLLAKHLQDTTQRWCIYDMVFWLSTLFW